MKTEIGERRWFDEPVRDSCGSRVGWSITARGAVGA
jgi:hypothetical protein